MPLVCHCVLKVSSRRVAQSDLDCVLMLVWPRLGHLSPFLTPIDITSHSWLHCHPGEKSRFGVTVRIGAMRGVDRGVIRGADGEQRLRVLATHSLAGNFPGYLRQQHGR